MGKKGKRTKWQALPMEEDSTAANGNGAVGYKKFRPFSTYNGKWRSIKNDSNCSISCPGDMYYLDTFHANFCKVSSYFDTRNN